MAFDGIVMKCVVNEWKSCLENGKISKVHEPNKNEIILGIYANGKNYALAICIDSNNCKAHLTTHSKPNPLHAPNFCMLLRKHLIGMRIKDISTFGFERIITFTLEGYDELNDLVQKKLIIELMGKHSNIILTNATFTIIDSLRHLDASTNSIRDILPAHPYLLPTSSKKDLLSFSSFEDFYKSISSNLETANLDTILSNHFAGISKLYLHYLFTKFHLTIPISKEEIKQIYTYLISILQAIPNHCLAAFSFIDIQEKGKKEYVIDFGEKDSPLAINFFLDDYYYEKENKQTFTSYRNTLLKLILAELNKYQKRLKNINQKLEECSHMEKYRLYGELITSNLYHIKEEKIEQITLENYYERNIPITIFLDKRFTPAVNARHFFKKYQKLKNALEIVTLQKKETAKEISYLESIVYELEKATSLVDITNIYEEISENLSLKTTTNKKGKKKTSSKKEITFSPTPFVLEEKYCIYIGKNNKQNDYLTLKFAERSDLWFHTKDIHGSHVILKTDGEEIPLEIINRCASIAAFYSKGNLSSNVPVDYTFVKYVKKPSGAKPRYGYLYQL